MENMCISLLHIFKLC